MNFKHRSEHHREQKKKGKNKKEQEINTILTNIPSAQKKHCPETENITQHQTSNTLQVLKTKKYFFFPPGLHPQSSNSPR
jgi:hypothetical protein